MAVIADFAAYPEWADQVKSVEILDTDAAGRPERVRFQMDAGPIKDSYTLDYTWAPDGRSVSWTLVKGQIQKAQNGSYALVGTARPDDGHLLARGRPEHPDDRHAAPQGREGDHRYGAQGAQAPRGGHRLTSRSAAITLAADADRAVHGQGWGRQDHARRGDGRPPRAIRAQDAGRLHRPRALAGRRAGVASSAASRWRSTGPAGCSPRTSTPGPCSTAPGAGCGSTWPRCSPGRASTSWSRTS